MESNLELNAYHTELIKKGILAAEEGKFVSYAEVKRLIAKMGRNKKKARKESSSGSVRKALKILAKAGKNSPPIPGDELPDTAEWFAAMDRVGGDKLLKDGRKQPRTPRRWTFD